MSVSFDVVVIGAGPGGLAAAVAAAEAGKSVCLIDDNATAGGQIWRGALAPAASWLSRIERSAVTMRLGWRVFDVLLSASRVPSSVCIESNGQQDSIEFSALILATGARELFLPFPGWTLPGVYGAGGLQAFVQSGFEIAGKSVVIAGTGPLLLAAGAHLRAAGARIVCIIEQAPLRRLAQFTTTLALGHVGKIAEGIGYSARTLGVRYRAGSWVTRALGVDRVRAVVIRSGPRTVEVETDMLAMGYHLVPNSEMARLIGCAMQGGFVAVNEKQQTSVKGVYCVGEGTGIGGVAKAVCEGNIAGLAASGRPDVSTVHAKERNKQMRFAHRLAAAFTLRDELRNITDGDTIVCRCEDVTRGALDACGSWRAAKLHTRCGMGPCQGRICGPAAEFLFGWQAPQPRPPLFPVDIALLGGTPSREAPVVK